MKKAKLTIPSDNDYLFHVRNFIKKIGIRNNFSSKVISAMMLGADEACSNIIRHSYQNNSNWKIHIEVLIKRSSFTLIIIDQGQPFDPRQVKDPDLIHYAEIGKVGGLGIMMIRKLMDDIKYKVSRRGNEFRLIKYREEFKKSKLFKILRFF